jgi:hypothetical protein
LYPHEGLSNPQVQRLTETQAEAFVPPDQGAIAEYFLNGAGEKESPTKQYKRPGPKLGYKRKKSVAFTTAGYNDASHSAVSPRKRLRTTNENEESGDGSMMPPASTSPDLPKLGDIPTLAAPPTSVPLLNGQDAGSGADQENGLSEVPVEVSMGAVGNGIAKRFARVSSKELEPAKIFEKAIAKKPMTGPERKKITVDGMGRKRVRDSKGRSYQYTLAFHSVNRSNRALHK